MKFTTGAATLALAQLTSACLLDGEAEGLLMRRQTSDNHGLEIGTGDRFDGGKKFPQGLGTQPEGTDLGAILSVKEVESAFKGLAAEYGFETFETPEKTHENRTLFGGKIGGKGDCDDAYRVYFNAGIHARERGSPDNLIYFISDLLYAEKHKTGLTYGGRTFSRCEVSKALNTGIVFVPLSNPDGVAYDQANNNCWRKNRNPEAPVDLNRNFDFLWDLSQFAPSVAPNVASDNPNSEVFHGDEAFSEPETRGIKWVMDKFSSVRWYLDIHSYAGVVLYSWGSDENQFDDPSMNFINQTLNDARGLMPDQPEKGVDGVYGEYIPRQDWMDALWAAMRTGNAMDAATGRHYETMQASYLYPTSGASDDYAYSRHFADPSVNKIMGYTIEFGFGNEAASCPFYPTADQYRMNMLETNAGFMEWLLAASEIGTGAPVTCPYN